MSLSLLQGLTFQLPCYSVYKLLDNLAPSIIYHMFKYKIALCHLVSVIMLTRRYNSSVSGRVPRYVLSSYLLASHAPIHPRANVNY